MPDVRTPDEWCKRFSVTVHGPDGWRGKSWDEPITEDEFWRRVAVSSCEMPVRGLGGATQEEGMAVGCAAATAGAPVSPVQATDHAGDRVSPVTDDMVERAARALYEASAANRFRNPPAWDSPEVEKTCEKQREHARIALSAALAGCTVARLPEPDGHDEDGPFWMDSRAAVFGVFEYGKPWVRTDKHDMDPDAAEVDALALLAAAREARRLAGGEQHG